MKTLVCLLLLAVVLTFLPAVARGNTMVPCAGSFTGISEGIPNNKGTVLLDETVGTLPLPPFPQLITAPGTPWTLLNSGGDTYG